MPDFVTLSCPTCGGTLRITDEIDRFACAHCGNEHQVRRGGGIVSLAPVVGRLDSIQVGTDRTATELTIRRLQDEVKKLEDEVHLLVTHATMFDQNGLLRALRIVKPKAYRDTNPGDASRLAKDQRKCFILVEQLTPDESRTLLTECRNLPVPIFGAENRGKMLAHLKPLPALKEKLESTQARLQAELRHAEHLLTAG